MKNPKGLAPRQSPDDRTVLARILDTPHLEQVVPKLQPDVLHRVIQTCGLEDCGEIVALATPEQLTRIFDLDLWRPPQPGMDEHFDTDRFGVWLEVLAECGASIAAQKLAQMNTDVVIAGLAQHARVIDGAVITPYRTTDGIEFSGMREPDGLSCDVGGYRLVAKRNDSWEAIVEILISLDAEHPDYFHRVMRGCRDLSNSGRELDGLDDLLDDEQQTMFDLALGREQRRDEQGYVTPAQARAFLEMSRQLQLGPESSTRNPIARAYLSRPHFEPNEEFGARPQNPEAEAALVDVLFEAGIIAPPPRALLNAAPGQTNDDKKNLRRIRKHMQFLFDHDHAAYARRNDELTFLANALMSGCVVQGRPFTAEEASDAAVAACNLGLENWRPTPPEDFLVKHDLASVFQVGWAVLHKDVAMYTAERLAQILSGFRCNDRDIQIGLARLRVQLSAACRAGTPWRARTALDVIAMLDMPAWAALLGLIAECPVLHAALSASRNRRKHSVSASSFEFISENSQIATIREFMQSLPETLA